MWRVPLPSSYIFALWSPRRLDGVMWECGGFLVLPRLASSDFASRAVFGHNSKGTRHECAVYPPYSRGSLDSVIIYFSLIQCVFVSFLLTEMGDDTMWWSQQLQLNFLEVI